MQSQNRFFDDLSKVATGAAGTLAGIGREMEQLIRKQMEKFVGGLDMVTREEFEAVKELAARARAEAAELRARLDAMQGVTKTAETAESGPDGGFAELDPTAQEARNRDQRSDDGQQE